MGIEHENYTIKNCCDPQWIWLRDAQRSVQRRCHKCWKCQARRVADYVGRGLAEASYSDQVVTLTLTYGQRCGTNAIRLVYSDIQKMLKRLRKDGFSVRYMAVGEYGSAKGRAHWHVILFFRGKKFDVVEHGAVPASCMSETVRDFYTLEPTRALVDRRHGGMRDTMFSWHYWPHGAAVCDPSVDFKSLRYALKYVFKDETLQQSVSHFQFSKKPLLGDAFFRDLAEKHASQSIGIKSPVYSIPGVMDAQGRPLKFVMRGRAWEEFVEHFQSHWRETRGGEPPFSECVEAFEDAQLREAVEASEIDIITRISAKDKHWTADILPGYAQHLRGTRKPWAHIQRRNDGSLYYYEVDGDARTKYLARIDVSNGTAELRAAINGRRPAAPNLIVWAS